MIVLWIFVRVFVHKSFQFFNSSSQVKAYPLRLRTKINLYPVSKWFTRDMLQPKFIYMHQCCIQIPLNCVDFLLFCYGLQSILSFQMIPLRGWCWQVLDGKSFEMHRNNTIFRGFYLFVDTIIFFFLDLIFSWRYISLKLFLENISPSCSWHFDKRLLSSWLRNYCWG